MSKVKRITRELCEAVNAAGSCRVDRENRVIRHCKILGRESPNRHGMDVAGTEYSTGAMAQALPLYEGRQVFIDHLRQDPSAERSMRDLAGVFRGVIQESDGLYGDFHYRSQHSYLADDAEQLPEAFGFSHNAIGAGVVRQGKYLIESITGVRSVDLVTRPATTNGLFESRGRGMAKTIREVIEGLQFDSKIVKRVLEMDGLDATAPMPEAGGESAEEHMGRAILAIVNDSTLDAAAKKKKVLGMLKLLDDTGASSDDTGASSDDTPTETPIDDTPTIESLTAKLRAFETDKAITDLCESLSFRPTPTQRKALASLPEADRKAFITEIKGSSSTRQAPRSQSAGNLAESRETVAVDGKAAASRWLS